MTKKTRWGILFCFEYQGKLSIRDKLVKREKGQVEALRDTIRNSQAAQVYLAQLVLDSLGSGGEELSRPPTAATGAVSHQLFQMVL